jgi:tetratricopeptide (TPR) repeat protein
MSRAGRLRQQVAVNKANITARRDLAMIYLDLLRPRRALELLEEGLRLAPEDAELIYLSGVALHKAGRHEEAVERLVRAVDKDQRLRHGHPYLIAGDALLALNRWEDAIDAYERFLDFNSSDVTGHTQLARAHAGAKDAQAARKYLLEGIRGWRSLPGSLKRRQFGAYLRAQWARITVLKDVGAALFALGGVALLVFAARAAYPAVAQLWAPDPMQDYYQTLVDGLAACGSQSTGDFAGAYTATPESGRRFGLSMPSEQERELEARALEMQKELYENFVIERDRIHSGTIAVQEFCLTKVVERTPELLRAQAIWHEDRNDPGDVGLVELRLIRGKDSVRFSFSPLGEPFMDWSVKLQRKP